MHRIPYVKLPKTQLSPGVGFGNRISRRFLDLRGWKYVPTGLIQYAYEIKFPSVLATSTV